jgi:hypothetical protein
MRDTDLERAPWILSANHCDRPKLHTESRDAGVRLSLTAIARAINAA